MDGTSLDEQKCATAVPTEPGAKVVYDVLDEHIVVYIVVEVGAVVPPPAPAAVDWAETATDEAACLGRCKPLLPAEPEPMRRYPSLPAEKPVLPPQVQLR